MMTQEERIGLIPYLFKAYDRACEKHTNSPEVEDDDFDYTTARKLLTEVDCDGGLNAAGGVK